MSQIRIATLQDRTSGVASVGLTGEKKKVHRVRPSLWPLEKY